MEKCSTENPLSNLSDVQIYWKLFFTTLILSASTFGGGFVIIGTMKQKFVSQLQWLQDEEMLDMTAIAQSSPGALGVNIAMMILAFVAACFLDVSAIIIILVCAGVGLLKVWMDDRKETAKWFFLNCFWPFFGLDYLASAEGTLQYH